MATIDDILAQRKAAEDKLDEKLRQARDPSKAGEPGIDDVIDDLERQKEDVELAAFDAAMSSDEMANALAALKAAVKELKARADEMVTATDFVKKLAGLSTATGKVVAALKRTG